MPIITAPSAGKPIATSNGAAIAAGVPNPDAPSMKQPKSQAMIKAWTRRSGLMLTKSARMVVMAPEFCSVFRSRIAPKIIHNTATVIRAPCNVDARTRVKLISHTVSAMAAAVR